MNSFKILIPHFKNYKKDLVFALISILVSALSGLYQPKLLENIQKALMAEQRQSVIQDEILLPEFLMFIMLHG
mgnify:CR=1 FL=1